MKHERIRYWEMIKKCAEDALCGHETCNTEADSLRLEYQCCRDLRHAEEALRSILASDSDEVTDEPTKTNT